MKICVISPNFPSEHSISFMFLDQICREFADLGHEVTVITRQSLTNHVLRHTPLAAEYSEITTDKGNTIKVYRKSIFTFGNSIWSTKAMNRMVYQTLKKLNIQPDIIYGHFWESAYAGYKFAKEQNIPLIAVAGEDYITLHNYIGPKNTKALRNYVSGAICVSSKSKEESINAGFATESQCIVIPNAINPNLFHKLNKDELRKKHNIAKDDFVVAFVGQFTERKGILRIAEALNRIGDDKIKAFFIGSGPQQPEYKGTIVSGRIDHDLLPEYLNCADVFVLPTQSEGCCNAMIEAMACGLPVISSDRSFNWDVLNNENAILIDPDNIEEITISIKKIYEDVDLRERLSSNALTTASELTLPKRATKIINYIKNVI